MTSSLDFTLQTSVTLPVDRIADLLICALEGGINYWVILPISGSLEVVEPTNWEYEDEDSKGSGDHYRHEYPLNPGGAILFLDPDDNASMFPDTESKAKRLRLDRESIQKGLTILAEKYPWHFTNILNEDDDAETADVFVQCCLFGEIVYG
jgi:hypothetical protein